MNLPSKIHELSIRNPHKIAVQSENGALTYQNLEKKINQTANAFESLGIKKGDRILIQIGNRFEFMYCYFAAMKTGAIIVPINPLYTSTEISYIVSDCQPSVYVCERFAKKNIEVVKNLSSNLLGVYVLDDENKETSFDMLISEQSNVYPTKTLNKDDVCEILYTSGTTGRPKGAMLTHHGLYTNADTFRDILHFTADDICLIVAPIYHAAAQTNCMNTMILAGATIYLHPKFETEKVLQILQDMKITYFFGPATMYALLLNHPSVNNYRLSLRIALTGGAPTPVELHSRWKKTFGFEILEGYGLSECSPVVTNHKPEDVKKPGSVGPAIPGVTVKIFNENEEEVAPGELGEIVVKGPNVMKGYWQNPEATQAVLKNGWFFTGDIGYKDNDGYVWIVDRKKDMIIRGGLNIYPREIEEVLYKHPKILNVAVIGIPDAIMGEELKAYYTLKNPNDSIDTEELRTFCKNYLAPYKVPRFFEAMDELPKTVSGKIQKTKLRELSIQSMKTLKTDANS